MLTPTDSPQTGADRTPMPAIALRARAHVPRRPLIAAALLAIALGIALTGVHAKRHPAVAPAVSHTGLSSLPRAAQGQISAALGADQRAYRVNRTAGGFAAFNPGQRLNARFGRSGVVVSSHGSEVGLRLSAVGYGSWLMPVGAVTPTARANRVTYSHPRVTEWYANGPFGLEQGFTIPRAPGTHSVGPLTFSIALSGNTPASLGSGGQSITLGRAGGPLLHYNGLTVADARGHSLHSWLELYDGRLLLRVDARGARYPLRIDPFIQQGERLVGSEVEHGFGGRVALSSDGNTALVGSTEAEGRGAAWVFTRSGNTWTQQARLAPLPGIGGLHAGSSVALSSDGNTALIGEVRTGTDRAGTAWVFTRSSGTWSQQGGALVGTGATAGFYGGWFGESVVLSSDGDTALIGDPNEKGNYNNYYTGIGAAWVFTRSDGSWSQQGKMLTGRGEVGEGDFGSSVALSSDGNTALIGAGADDAGGGAAWVFTRSGAAWTEQGEKLTGSGEAGGGAFGRSVALSSDGNTALIGAGGDDVGVGAAWVFTRSGAAWSQQGKKLTGSGEAGGGAFGRSVALSSNGTAALIGGPLDNGSVGAAWTFTRSGEGWTQSGEKLVGAGEVGTAEFGYSVALSSDDTTALVGGPADDNTSVGAAWVFASPVAVTAVSPHAGPQAGGTAVVITGAGFGEATAVHFGTAEAAQFQVRSSTEITAISPPGTGTVDVTVTTAEGTSSTSAADLFTYGTSVTGVSPDTGFEAGGTSVTITGTRFTEASAVDFGSTPAASFTVDSQGTITTVSPPGTGTVDVTVTTPEGTSPTSPADQFSYVPVPTVSGVSPNEGPQAGGTSVAINGTNLSGASAVKFGSTNAATYTVNSATSITAVSPAGMGSVDVTVTTPDGTSATSSADQFSYVPVPTVTGVSPDSGAESGGTSVTVSGTNLTGATTVMFGATSAASFKVNSASSITAVSPVGAGTIDVTVTTAGGTSTMSPADEFRYLAAPEYGRCVKVAKGAGLFATGNCTTAGGTKSYEWYPAGGADPLVKAGFTTKIKALTEAKLLIAGKHVISCTGETGTGEYSGPKTVANVAITLTGCHLEALGSCQSLAAAEGEVVLTVLEGELGVTATSTGGPLKNKIGTDLKPASDDVVAAFACGGTPVLVTGSVIGEVPRNSMKLSTTPTFIATTKGTQKPTRFEGGEEDVLLTKLGEGGAFEQTGLKLAMVQTNQEKVEVNSVF